MITIDYFKLETTSKIDAAFTEGSNSKLTNLEIDYRLFEDLCLTFTC